MLFSRDRASSDGDESFVVPAPGVAAEDVSGGVETSKGGAGTVGAGELGDASMTRVGGRDTDDVLSEPDASSRDARGRA